MTFYEYGFNTGLRPFLIIINDIINKNMEKKEPLVSIIIPIYNAQEYLRECLDSVVNQTLKDIEIICVNDGSTDASIDILNEYKEKDNRIILIEQENSNAGKARNVGKAIAKGKYLIFWDGDDYFKLHALEEMYLQCEKDSADICVCKGRQYYNDIKLSSPWPRYLQTEKLPEKIPFNIDTCNDHILDFTNIAVWNKMFRRSFIEKNNLSFKEIRNHNDAFFVENALCLAERITIVNKELVYYRKNKAGGLVTTSHLGAINALNTYLDIANSLKSKNVYPERSFANMALENIVYLLNNISEWNVYKEMYELLQNGYLEKLGIKKHQIEKYYYVDYYNELVEKIYTLKPEEYAKWIWRYYYLDRDNKAAKSRVNNEKNRKKIKSLESDLIKSQDNNEQLKSDFELLKGQYDKLSKEFKKIKKVNKDLKQSLSFKIGRFLTWIPRKIRDIFK